MTTIKDIDQFDIFIPTRARLDRQLTIKHLPSKIRCLVNIVIDEAEVYNLEGKRQVLKMVEEMELQRGQVLVFPASAGEGIGPVRQFCIDHTEKPYVIFFDDDLDFSVRRDGKLVRADERDILKMVNLLLEWLSDGLMHVAVSTREGNNWVEAPFASNGRAMRLLGYNADILKKEGIRFDVTEVMEDFHVTLSLLEMGYGNRVSYTYAQGQPGSNIAGGCSTYRTNEMNERAARELAKLHPGVVTVKKKKAWKGFEGEERVDANISWHKAFKIGVMKRKTGGGMTKFFG